MHYTSALKFTAPLKIVYALTLGGVVAFYLYVYLLYCLGNLGGTGDTVFTVFLRNLNFTFFVTAFPLAVFTCVFLTKGGGLDYLRSWNKNKTLAFSGLAVVIGYVLVIFFPNTSVGHFFHVNHSDFIITYFGLASIVFGFTLMFVVYARTISRDKETRFFAGKWRTKKTFFAVVAILVVSVVIGGYILKIQREYDVLQDNYHDLKEGLPFLVNDNWTNNEDGNSKYINYKGAIFNSGLNTKHNITIIVSVRDAEGNLLKRAEFLLGDVKGWQYEAFDVNVEYSGEMAKVYTTYDWNAPPSFLEH